MNKKVIITALAFTAGSASYGQGESMVINGIYQGRDLYVKNPFSPDGVGFCIYEVSVNGRITRDEINSSAFAVDFNMLDIKKGSPVEIELKHKSGCKPLVLNPESLKPVSSFEILSMKMDKNKLVWVTVNESGPLPYIIEQFRWNKWVKIGEIQGEGNSESNKYSFEVTPHSGENRIRVKQVDYSGKPRISESVSFNSTTSAVSYDSKKVTDEILFSSPTRYEVFDKYGNLVKTGYGKSVDIRTLITGEDYYLNYDNSFGETFRKR